MLRSDDLRIKIKEADAMLEMMQSHGWTIFIRDVVQPLADSSFREWKKTPAEQANRVIELQMSAKFADMILDKPRVVQLCLRRWMDELQLIVEGEEEDSAIKTD